MKDRRGEGLAVLVGDTHMLMLIIFLLGMIHVLIFFVLSNIVALAVVVACDTAWCIERWTQCILKILQNPCPNFDTSQAEAQKI